MRVRARGSRKGARCKRAPLKGFLAYPQTNHLLVLESPSGRSKRPTAQRSCARRSTPAAQALTAFKMNFPSALAMHRGHAGQAGSKHVSFDRACFLTSPLCPHLRSLTFRSFSACPAPFLKANFRFVPKDSDMALEFLRQNEPSSVRLESTSSSEQL